MVSVGRHRSISVARQSAGPLALFRSILQNLIHSDHHPTPLMGYTTISTPSLSSNPLGLYLGGFFFVVAASFAVGSYLLRPFVSVFTGAAIDPELRDHRPVDHLPSGQHRLSRLEVASSFLGNLAQVSSSPRGPCI